MTPDQQFHFQSILCIWAHVTCLEEETYLGNGGLECGRNWSIPGNQTMCIIK